MSGIQLEVVGAGRGGLQWDLAKGALRIGRAPGNDLILTDDQVSSHHAVVVLVDGQVMLTDLRSTNGTTLNGERRTDSVVLAHGDVVGLGPNVKLVVRVEEGSAVMEELVLEDSAAGLRLPLGRTPVHVAGHAIELVNVHLQEVVCRVDGEERTLAVDDTLVLDGAKLVVRRPGALVPTVRAGEAAFPYVVQTSLDGPTGPLAMFQHGLSGAEHTISAENRAVLIHLLAERLRVEREQDPAATGWCDDGSLRTAIWGAASRKQLANNLNVVIRRTRKELDGAGFDGSCIQKVYGHTRLFVREIRGS